MSLVIMLNDAAYAQKTAKQDVPPAVISSFETTYPNGQVISYSKEKRQKMIAYEIESNEGKARRDIIYSADGKVIETEESIPHELLPPAVAQTLQNKYPKGKIGSAEKLTRGIKLEYEVLIKEGKSAYEVVLDENGQILKSTKE